MPRKENPATEADQETEEIAKDLEAATNLMKAWPNWKRPVLGWWSNREPTASEGTNGDNGHIMEPLPSE
jgi:hypothetical protein